MPLGGTTYLRSASLENSFECVKSTYIQETKMASLKAEKPVGTQAPPQAKKEPVKPSGTTPKAPASRPAPKKAEQKPREPKKKAAGAK
ncbi:hypothetical protein CJ030_MR7G000074 [Morella rubra]|uniref:Uncharacterized protein n=1 Tax=Morella rubra TaxID=262757 RepID=A0A6A1V5F1_9ROSI|nr:hypothetical protein CJ030_MR7G000074 [Morella rubra]